LLLATSCFAQSVPPVQPTVPFTGDLNKYPGLLPEFGRFIDRVQHNLQFPPERSQSRLLPLLPESTMFYAAIPNYGDVAHQLLGVFHWELEHSSVLADWWQHGGLAATGPKLEDSVERFYQLSQYLGEEIVVSGAADHREPSLLMVAEVRKPGLKKFLQQTLKDLSGEQKPPVRILDAQELAAAGSGRERDEPVVLVRSDFVVVAPSLAAMRDFNARLDRSAHAFVSTPFGQRMAQAYEGGTTILAGADLHGIMSQVPSPAFDQAAFQRTGFADVKYFVWQHRNVAGRTVSEWELSFISPRHGMAAWLAAPRPLGSLDFVSSRAMLVATLILNNPGQVFDDIQQLATAANPNALASVIQLEQALNLSLKEDLFDHLGGEITLELDSVTPPAPVWKTLVRVNDPSHLQQTLSMLLAVAHLTATQFERDGVTYYTVRIPTPKTTLEIGCAFVDGYLIIGSSPDAVAGAVELHGTVDSLGKSEKFLASLPPGHAAGASALLYEDPIAMTAQQLRQVAPEMAGTLSGQQSSPVVFGAYGEETAIRGVSTNTSFDAGAVLIGAAIAIPNLLRTRIAANEASAVGNLRTVNVAQITYATMYPERGVAPDLATLGPDPRRPGATSAEHAGLIDPTLGAASCTAGAWCTKSGFRFSLTAVCKQKPCKEFVVVATPVTTSTGARNFCSTSDGVVRSQRDRPLTTAVTARECQAWAPVHEESLHSRP
ncbi:MAG TPA: hypothetical protein VEC95_04435, partial [Terriglobales bacterium]|nr:hypothetical protein [Terriglobales bacterium]